MNACWILACTKQCGYNNASISNRDSWLITLKRRTTEYWINAPDKLQNTKL